MKILAKAGAILQSDTCISECSKEYCIETLIFITQWLRRQLTHSTVEQKCVQVCNQPYNNRLSAKILPECDICHSLQISAYFRCVEKCRVWIFTLQRITVWVMEKFIDQYHYNGKRNKLKWTKFSQLVVCIIENGPLYLGIIHSSSIVKTTRLIRLWMTNIIYSYGFAFCALENKQINNKKSPFTLTKGKRNQNETKNKTQKQNIQSVGTSWNISFSAALFLPVSLVSNRTKPTAFDVIADFVWWWCWWCAFVEVGEASDTKADYFDLVLFCCRRYCCSFFRVNVPSIVIPYILQCWREYVECIAEHESHKRNDILYCDAYASYFSFVFHISRFKQKIIIFRWQYFNHHFSESFLYFCAACLHVFCVFGFVHLFVHRSIIKHIGK